MTTETQRTRKDTIDSQKDEIFAAWRARKESMSNMASLTKEAPLRRQSNVNRGILNKGFKGLMEMRRMTMFKAKSDVSADMIKVAKENTYKMKPDAGTEFSPSKVATVVKQLLESELEDMTYDHDTTSQFSCELAEKIKERVKELKFERYKIVTNVILTSVGEQGMEVASRCCWDHTVDNYACITHSTKHVRVVAMVFGLFYE